MRSDLIKQNFYLPKLVSKAFDSIDHTNRDYDYIFKIDIVSYYESIKNIYKQVLTPKEIDKALKFRKPDDFKRFVCARYGLRKILSSFVNVFPQNIVFNVCFNQKPYVDDIKFNVSHCGDLVLIAVSQNDVGIDIEFNKRDFEFKSLLDLTFNQKEINLIENSVDSTSVFFWLWTRKEALLKATGEGIIDEMNQLSVLDDNIFRLNKMHHLYSFEVNNEYIACFAASSVKNIIFSECVY